MTESRDQLIDLITRLQHADLSMFDAEFLDTILNKRMTENNCSSLAEYGSFFENDVAEQKCLIDSLHISYTEFFRNTLTFAVLENIIFPLLLVKLKETKRKELRIWSAACASGQEAYSLAILLEEFKAASADAFTYRIFATDQSDAQINEAMQGTYSENAVKNVSLKRAGDWFDRQGNVFAVKPALKKNIDFSRFNLFNEHLTCPPVSIFGDFDLVMCCNLLFYYKSDFQKIIIDKTGDCLVSGGFFAAGEAERSIMIKNGYHEVYSQSAIFQR